MKIQVQTFLVVIIVLFAISVFLSSYMTQTVWAASKPYFLLFDHLCCLPVLHPGQTIIFSINIRNPSNLPVFDVKPDIIIKPDESVSHIKIETDILDTIRARSMGEVHVKITSDPQLPLKDLTIITSFTKRGDDGNTTKAVEYSDTSILKIRSSLHMTPLKQLKLGVPIAEIECLEGLHLVVIDRDNSPHPACVKTSSFSRLVNQGWEDITSYMSHIVPHQ